MMLPRSKLEQGMGTTGIHAYWAMPVANLLQALQSSPEGLSADVAARRLASGGPNALKNVAQTNALAVLARQFRSPLVLILLFAAGISASVRDVSDAAIILVIVMASCILSFTQEYGASKAAEALKGRIARKVTALRDGTEAETSVEDIVPGDVIRLSAGSLIPADGVVIDARDFNVTESFLTGEAFPVEKAPGVSLPDAPVSKRLNAVFTGSSVRSGTATMVAVNTATNTEFAGIADSVSRSIPETEFARGIRRFGYLMAQIMLVIVIVVFVANLSLHRPLIESLLFSLALAVGLTPELLPAIISMTLARGARTMARNGVIVRRLNAIENLGSMDLLCTDKTGTLTQGVVRLDGHFDPGGNASDDVLLWARLNATLQTGIRNPLDDAIAAVPGETDALSAYRKIGEIPYDFIRKRLSVIVGQPADPPADLMICKGAVHNILEICSSLLTDAGSIRLDEAGRKCLGERFQAWSADGFRVLAVAIRHFDNRSTYGHSDERDLCFAGFLIFLDPPKTSIGVTLAKMTSRGVRIKVITGDNRFVAAHVAKAVGLNSRAVMTGDELSRLTKNALFARVAKTDIFAEIDPNQKERIIEAFRRRGNVVGYLGDGINDAPALHEADVGISVDSAVDVAREAADIILLKQDLDVLVQGIDDGRRTFANTMKYISITTSANFGNMISMACASLFLPFLPMLAKQILLNNLLSSIPSLAIATDNVDRDQTGWSRRWDIGSVRRFMISFGLVSSLFDFLTFGFLILILHAAPEAFRTAWFVESLLTQLAILLIVRTRKPIWESRPGRLLLTMTVAVALLAVAIPYLPYAGRFGFLPLPFSTMAGLVLITVLYIIASETTKHWLFMRERRINARHRRRRVAPEAA